MYSVLASIAEVPIAEVPIAEVSNHSICIEVDHRRSPFRPGSSDFDRVNILHFICNPHLLLSRYQLLSGKGLGNISFDDRS